MARTHDPAGLYRDLPGPQRLSELALELHVVLQSMQPTDLTRFWRLRWALLAALLRGHHQMKNVTCRSPACRTSGEANRRGFDDADIWLSHVDRLILWDRGEFDWARCGEDIRNVLADLAALRHRHGHMCPADMTTG